MDEVSGPVVAIAAILAAVFIPVAFLGGISGQIYRQFALTIAASVLISAFSALSLSPALSALLLQPRAESKGLLGRAFHGFNVAFDWTKDRYLAACALWCGGSPWRWRTAGVLRTGGRAFQNAAYGVPAGGGSGCVLHRGAAARWRFAGAYAPGDQPGGRHSAKDSGVQDITTSAAWTF